jgi:hypothetical protein
MIRSYQTLDLFGSNGTDDGWMGREARLTRIREQGDISSPPPSRLVSCKIRAVAVTKLQLPFYEQFLVNR